MAQGPDEIGGERRVNVQTNESTARSSAPTTDELRTQIEATRTEMGDTIGAIQDRLRPGRLMADVKDVVKEATVGRVKSLTHKASARAGEFGDWSTTPASALQKMKDHPVPMALVGAAATGLFVGALRRRRAIDPAAGYVTHKRGATSNRGIRSAARFMAIAGAGLACWAIWKAQTTESAFPPPERRDSPGGAL
jgi:hypothetical protein